MQRSFEVVWAVFRVGEFIGRKELRELLEARALGYLSDKTVDNLDSLDEVVRLAMQVGEIKDVNGRVILRETGNLRGAISERLRSEEVQRELSEGQIEEIFKGKALGKTVEDRVGEFGKELPELKRDMATENVEDGNNTDTATIINSNFITKESEGNNISESGKGLPNTDFMTSYERKQTILNLLKQRSMCGMREITTILPNVSERTLRYDVKGLVDRKLVERVGKGGPDSFLRLSKKE